MENGLIYPYAPNSNKSNMKMPQMLRDGRLITLLQAGNTGILSYWRLWSLM